MRKELGKIKSVRFGEGGYQDAMFGFSFELGGEGWGVSDFWGMWMEHSEGCKWTIKDQDKAYLDCFKKTQSIMSQAKVRDFSQLKGIPIEAEFDGNLLKSWRVLTEVI